VAELRSSVIGLLGLKVTNVARDGSLTSRTVMMTGDSGSIRLLMDVGDPLLEVSSGIHESMTDRRVG
jgi:hypothetical protein